MAVHARLKNEFTEDEKYHNVMSWLILWVLLVLRSADLCSKETKEHNYHHGNTNFPTCAVDKLIGYHTSHVTRKPVFGIFDQVRLKLACSTSEAS